MYWNFRGAGSGEFACEMKEIMREHIPHVIILLEPRTSGDTTDTIYKKLGKKKWMKKWIRSEAAGFSGNVFVMWDDVQISLKLVYAHRFFLHMEVRLASWLDRELTVVYANPNPSIKRHLWDKLDEIKPRHPWVLMRDFNCVLKAKDWDSNTGESSRFQN